MAVTSVFVQPTYKPSGKTFANLQSGGLATLVDAVLAANTVAATAPTAAPTVSATGGGSTGGLLAAGVYYAKITEHNGLGETTASPETTSFTVAAGNIPQVTFPALKAGNAARNVYLTAAGGASNSEVLYAAGITTATFNLATAAPASTVVPPAVGSGGFSPAQISHIRSIRDTRGFRSLHDFVTGHLRGDALTNQEFGQRVTDFAVAHSFIAACLAELGTLMMANPGTLRQGVNSGGNPYRYRTFP